MPTKTSTIKNVTIYSAYVILIWGFYRLLIKLPDEIEETVLKPIIWLLPLIFILRKEKLGLSSLGITLKNFFPAVYYSLGLGAFFVMEAVLVNYLKYGGFNFGANIGNLPLINSLGLSFATAISEELSFRGYIFGRLQVVLKDEWKANIVTSLLWALMHVPVTFFVLKLSGVSAIVYLALTTIFGVGSAFIYARTKNIASSIFLHVLWEWPIILFR